MKRNTVILIKTTSLVLAFMLFLGVGIMSLSFSHSGVKPNDSNFLTPDLAVNAPTSQELLQKKFEIYNTVTEEDGKSVVTIFSEEQITDIRTRRENGEWFWLSGEEMLYLINDTVKLFETYDIVYIRDLEGNLKKYYGLSFFSSEEYYASFGGFDLGVTDASFDLKKDVYETILERVRVLNTAFFPEQSCILTDLSEEPTDEEKALLNTSVNPWFSISGTSAGKRYEYYAWRYSREDISVKRIDSSVSSLAAFMPDTIVFSQITLPEWLRAHKYDVRGKTAVIELYDEKTQNLIARLRYTEIDNAAIISRLQSGLSEMERQDGSSGSATQITTYRATVYLNGFDTAFYSPNPTFRYCPDGNIDLFSFTDGNDIFQNDYLPLNGGMALTELINELLEEEKILP